MHQSKVEFDKKKFINLNQMWNKELKIQREREREKEYSPICVGKIQIEWKKENKIFIVKKNGEKKSQNKRNMKESK